VLASLHPLSESMVLKIAYYLPLGFDGDIDTAGCSVILTVDYVFWLPL